MQTADFNYHLPAELIAQQPASPRDHSRLLVFDRSQNKIIHDHFYNIAKYLTKQDVLVFNNSKVFPARLIMTKATGGKLEVFLLKNIKGNLWQCLIGGRLPQDFKNINLKIGSKLTAQIIKKNQDQTWQVRFNKTGQQFEKIINQYGHTPLPPYIKTVDSKKIKEQYQTTYASRKGSVAAPTAGLHFTKKLIKTLNKKGVQTEFITLHVGLGTFAPVKVKKTSDHPMHAELVSLSKATATRLNSAKAQGKKIIAVGTTSLRLLEALVSPQGKIKAADKEVNIFISPGYKFKFIDSLITNFHLPCSTLLMLVSAMMLGKNKKAQAEQVKKIYKTAIKEEYRFYSFGDAMFIK